MSETLSGVANGNWRCWLLFNIQSSDYGATTVAKVSQYSTFTRSTVSFDSSRSRNRPM